jgi:iron(III) transport system substrate-binding protein
MGTKVKLTLASVGVWTLLGAVVGCQNSAPIESKQGGKAAAEKKVEAASTPPQKKTLTVYCGRKQKLIGSVMDGFQAKNPQWKVQVKYAGTAQLAATLMEEGERSPADVFIGQDASTLAVLEGKNLFRPIPEKTTTAVAKGHSSAAGKWVGIAGRSRVLAYNTKKLKPADLPANIDELTTAKWKGRVGWAPENASFQSFVAAMLQLRGPEKTKTWLKGMVANSPKGFPSNTPAVMAISRGEIDVALTNHYYLYRLKKEYGEAFPVANHFFNQQDAASMVNVAGAAILKTGQNQAGAEALIAYLVDKEGQEKFANQNHEFPLAAGVKPPAGLPTFAELKTPAIDLASLDDLKQTVAILRETGTLP